MANPAAGDGPTSAPTIEQLFFLDRIQSATQKLFVVVYFPLATLIFILRLFVGAHTFLVACLLRKSTALRSFVLRVMCTILGVAVVSEGKRDQSARVLVANHVSVLDHLAVDLVEPCLLPSVWDIPAIIRWCFGYVELGASRGRAELVRQAKELVNSEPLPLLAFPEGVITNGQKALLKFNTWSFDVSSRVQPVAVRVWRPTPWALSPSHISTTWWNDVFWFLVLPFTVVKLHFLPALERAENETVDEFALRCEQALATELNIQTSRFDARDAAEAAKRWSTARDTRRAAIAAAKTSRPADPRSLDETAMRIKQSYPGFHLAAIRTDLEKTKNQNLTVENIKSGRVTKGVDGNGKISMDASSWKKMFESRKWDMIETNRSKYMQRL